jgi:eukaryotic-like serine/threonine-protein kinase
MALVLAAQGGDALATWLTEVGLRTDDYQDERASISLATVRRAAIAFAARVEWTPWTKLGHALVDPQCIAWLDPLVRSASDVTAALSRLGKDVDDDATVRAEVVDRPSARAQWQIVRLRIATSHEPTLEEGGWLGHVREAEAIAIAYYYGERATVTEDGDALRIMWPGRRPAWLAVLSILFPAALVALGSTVAQRWVFWVGLVQLVLGLLAAFAARKANATRDALVPRNKSALLERVLTLREAKPAAVQVGDFSGQTIAGRYRVLHRLGTGGSGAVYKAERMDDSKFVAVKLLRAGAAHDGASSDRLRREAEALGLAWHPHVVEVYDHGRLPDGTSYMVMEFLDGETLQERLDRDGPLSLAAFSDVFEKVLQALAAIHAAGVVHRDVKPDNVFMLKDPVGPSSHTSSGTKLFDFGIARVEWEEMRLTGKGTPLGTQGYIAPEQSRGEEVTGLADIYSMGALAYATLTGKVPSEARAWGEVPIPLVDLFESALSEDTSLRPESPKKFLERFRVLRG